MPWTKVNVRMQPFTFRSGLAGPPGAALGIGAGGVEFHFEVEIETDQECKIRSWNPNGWAVVGAGIKLSGPGQYWSQRSFESKQGCVDSEGRQDAWDRLVASCTWLVESTVPLPVWTPFTGFITLPNPFATQQTIKMELVIWPNGSGAPTKRERAYVDGQLQYDHT